MQYDLIIRHAHLHRRDGLVDIAVKGGQRSEEHTSELQSQSNLVCRLLLEKKKTYRRIDSRWPVPDHDSRLSQTISAATAVPCVDYILAGCYAAFDRSCSPSRATATRPSTG